MHLLRNPAQAGLKPRLPCVKGGGTACRDGGIVQSDNLHKTSPQSASLTAPFTQGSLSKTGKYCKNPTYDGIHRSDLTVLQTPNGSRGLFAQRYPFGGFVSGATAIKLPCHCEAPSGPWQSPPKSACLLKYRLTL